jgi:DNA-binding transcriptional LysR family regulator
MKPLGILDPELLQTLASIAEKRSFSRAAESLGLAQSSVSAHVKRLEEAVGRKLIARTTHALEFTPDGEALLAYAGQVLELTRQAERQFSPARFAGALRFGFCDGIEAPVLPDALAILQQRHPGLQLAMETGRVYELLARLDSGALDLVLAVNPAGGGRGHVLWQSTLAWLGADIEPDGVVPLVARRPPSVTRTMMVNALTRANRPWAVKFESDSFAALRAAALAGLGVMAFPRDVLPPGTPPLPAGNGLPDLGAIELFLAVRAGTVPPVVTDFAALLRTWTPEMLRPAR